MYQSGFMPISLFLRASFVRPTSWMLQGNHKGRPYNHHNNFRKFILVLHCRGDHCGRPVTSTVALQINQCRPVTFVDALQINHGRLVPSTIALRHPHIASASKNYAKKNINTSGNIIPINANFQPRSLKDNLPLGIIKIPLNAIVINESANTSE